MGREQNNMEDSRQNINIELAAGNKERLEKLREWNGMTQKELVGRVINWFCSQDRVVQQIILGQIPEEVAPDVAMVVLKRIAAIRTGEPSGRVTDSAHEGIDDVIEIP